jgi:hypothetical protein
VSEVYVFSLKVGASHGLWQLKISGTHERVMMHGLRSILDPTCRLLGLDRADRSVVYLFWFSAEPFQGSQVCLERTRKARGSGGNGCSYKVKESRIGDFAAMGSFPGIISERYLHSWPERIYFRLEKSLAGGIVS